MSLLGSVLGAAGGVLGSVLQKSAAKKQYNQQVSFAQNAIQWKAADAIKAGLHPLAALGANTVSYSPQQVGDMAGPLSNMGQDIGRSIEATKNGTERSAGQIGALQLERAGLENDLLRTQIASEQARLRGQVGPPLPTDGGQGQLIPGQGQTLMMGGQRIATDPNTSNSQDFENRYGEPAEWIASPGIAWNDLKHNAKNMTLGQILKWVDSRTRVIPPYKPTRKRGGYPAYGAGRSGGW